MGIMRKIGYEEIMDLHTNAVEMIERGINTVCSDYIVSYCEDAFEYIELLENHGFEADFSLESLQGMFMAMMLFQRKYSELGMEIEECMDLVREKLAGYLLFSVYSHYESKGIRTEIKANINESGLVLVVPREEGKQFVFDPVSTLDKAFESLDDEVQADGIMILSRQDDFIDAVYESVGC